MSREQIVSGLLVLGGVALIVCGVWMLYGIGWALIIAGVIAILMGNVDKVRR